MGAVLASSETLALMRVRMGEDRAGESQQALGWGEVITIGEVRVWLQPAGHVLGSAQVAMEWRGSRAVVSGYPPSVGPPAERTDEPGLCQGFAAALMLEDLRVAEQTGLDAGLPLPIGQGGGSAVRHVLPRRARRPGLCGNHHDDRRQLSRRPP